jgi:hypothetical protein
MSKALPFQIRARRSSNEHPLANLRTHPLRSLPARIDTLIVERLIVLQFCDQINSAACQARLVVDDLTVRRAKV